MAKTQLNPSASLISNDGYSSTSGQSMADQNLTPYAFGPGLFLQQYGNGAVQELMRDNPTSEAWDFYANAFTASDQDLQDQISSWRQTREGNCATVAVSKAATDAMGTRAFQDVIPTTEGFKVILRDGTEVNLTIAELEEAQANSAFKGQNESALAFGTLQYAVTAKQALAAGHEDAKTYSDALKALNNGESPNRVAKFMGLQNDKSSISSSQLVPRTGSPAFGGKDSVVAWSSKHAVFADRNGSGHTADHYGDGVRYNGTDTNGQYRRRNGGNNVVRAFAFNRDDGQTTE